MHWIRGEQGIKLCLYLQLWIQSSGWDGLMTFELTKDTQLSGCYCPMSWLTTNRQPLCCYYRHINKSQTLDCPTVFTDMSDQTADTSCTVRVFFKTANLWRCNWDWRQQEKRKNNTIQWAAVPWTEGYGNADHHSPTVVYRKTSQKENTYGPLRSTCPELDAQKRLFTYEP